MGDLHDKQARPSDAKASARKAGKGNSKQNPSQHSAFAGIDLVEGKLKSIGPATGYIVAFSNVARSEAEPEQKRAVAIAAKGDKCICKINAEGETLSILIAAIRHTFSSDFTVNSGDSDNYIELSRRQ